jgi:glycosyltransferase involved in cell wall biosynthesis
MEKLTAVVPTLNESRNIVECLNSLRWADELIVVDSHSSDDTVELARGIADRVELHRFEGFSKQKNWCVGLAKHRWVFLVDADERVPRGLRDEIKNALDEPAADGYWVRRRNHFLGRRMRWAGWGRDRVLRLFDKEKAHYPDRLVHEKLVVDGNTADLRSPLLHYPYRNLDDYWEKCNRYARLSAMELHKRGRRSGAWEVALKPPARFLRMYVMQLGLLDGFHGLLLCGLSAYQIYVRYAILWELWREDESRPH